MGTLHLQCGGEKARTDVAAKPAEMHATAWPRRSCEMPAEQRPPPRTGRSRLAAPATKPQKTAQESSARGENRGHRGGTMRAEGALHTSVSGAWRRPSRWCGEVVARDKRRAAGRRCSHPSALSAGSPVQPNSRELSTKCMEPCSNSGHVVTTSHQVPGAARFAGSDACSEFRNCF